MSEGKWRRRYNPPSFALQGVATPLSRLILLFPMCSRGVAATLPQKGPVAPHSGGLRGVSQVNRAWAATLWRVALHLDTKLSKSPGNNDLFVRGLLDTNPADPTLESGLALPFSGVDLASIQHRFDIDFLIWPYFRIRGWGPRDLRLINPITRLFQGITREIHNFLQNNYFKNTIHAEIIT